MFRDMTKSLWTSDKEPKMEGIDTVELESSEGKQNSGKGKRYGILLTNCIEHKGNSFDLVNVFLSTQFLSSIVLTWGILILLK